MPGVTATPDGIRLRIRLTPRGGADRVDGWIKLADGASVLQVRVRVAPEDGAANEALLRLVALTLDLPKSAAKLTSGQTARVKEIAIAGDPDVLMERVRAAWPE